MISMPAVIVLIACKTVISGPPDQNASFTKAENREWAIEHSMMVCRRHEIQLYDSAVDHGALPIPFTQMQCRQSAPMVAVQFDQQHRNTPWRAWRMACPTPIVDTRTGHVIGYKMPECGKRDVVRCDVDTEI